MEGDSGMNAAYDFKIKFPNCGVMASAVSCGATVAVVVYDPAAAAWMLRQLGYLDASWWRVVDEVDVEGRRRQIFVFPLRR
jgi:hypothetical protein